MFFKKKKHDDKDWYCLAIMTEYELDEEEFEELADRILSQVDNIGMTSHLVRTEWEPERLEVLDQRFSPTSLSNPCFIVNLIVQDDIKKEQELLEKKHKWKKLFGLITLNEYMEAQEYAMLHFKNTVYCTGDIDKAIEFLNRQPLLAINE